jgi:RTA1 like protein
VSIPTFHQPYRLTFNLTDFDAVEFVGYIGRALSSKETPNWTLGPYIIQALLLLVAPALFAASIYMTLGRIILVVEGEQYSLIRKRLLTKIFVLGDVLSFLIQAAGIVVVFSHLTNLTGLTIDTGGGQLASKSQSARNIGKLFIITGLCVQIVFFGFFLIVAFVFHARIRKHPTTASSSSTIQWKRHLLVLYACSTLIMIRSIFRVIEYIGGYDGYLISHEVFLYIFDAVLMLCVMVLFNIIHPYQIKILLDEKKSDGLSDPLQKLGYASGNQSRDNHGTRDIEG